MARKISHTVYFDPDQWSALERLCERAKTQDPSRPISLSALVRRGLDLVIAETWKRLDVAEDPLVTATENRLANG